MLAGRRFGRVALVGRDGLTPMMSACWAANVSSRRPPPAIRTGGPPGRNGLGDPSSPEIR